MAGISYASPTAAQTKAQQPAPEQDFSFALLGDSPYSPLDELSFQKVLAQASLGAAFAIHVGDIKSGTETCSDELLTRRVALLDSATIPLVYLPGDNEWVDCGRLIAGSFNPVERLDKLRQLAFNKKPFLGAGHLVIQSQNQMPEHKNWIYNGVHFASFNLPGSFNGIDLLPQTHIDDRAWHLKSWLHQIAEKAVDQKARGLVLAVHANIGLRGGKFFQPSEKGLRAYGDFRAQLSGVCQIFSRPILLLHGDSHTFKIGQPDPRYSHLMSVESFGAPFTSSWVRISVSNQIPELFRAIPNHL